MSLLFTIFYLFVHYEILPSLVQALCSIWEKVSHNLFKPATTQHHPTPSTSTQESLFLRWFATNLHPIGIVTSADMPIP